MPGVDSAIVAALGLDPATAVLRHHESSGFASTYKLTGHRIDAASGKLDGAELQFFVKTGTGADAAVMFRGEYASLNAVADAVADFCPRAHAHGTLEDRTNTHFLATDFLELGGGGSAGAGRSLAAKLAEMHTRDMSGAAPDKAKPFGFPANTCCGSTEQDNTWKASWAEFYADNRLRHIAKACRRRNGPDAGLEAAVEHTAATVVPRLLSDGHLRSSQGGDQSGGGGPIRPVVIHGDLWSGNHGRGRIVRASGVGGTTGVEEVVFDPSSVYGHAEYELGIMRMFGGYSPSFWREYAALVPKDEPVEEWEDRLALYEL